MSAASRKANAVLVIDVGGTHVKVLATGQRDERKILSGSSMTASKMVRDIKRVTKNSEYGLVSIGLPILRREARCAFPSQRLNAFALNSIRVAKSQLLNAERQNTQMFPFKLSPQGVGNQVADLQARTHWVLLE
jgi:hypothetical protein